MPLSNPQLLLLSLPSQLQIMRMSIFMPSKLLAVHFIRSPLITFILLLYIDVVYIVDVIWILIDVFPCAVYSTVDISIPHNVWMVPTFYFLFHWRWYELRIVLAHNHFTIVIQFVCSSCSINVELYANYFPHRWAFIAKKCVEEGQKWVWKPPQKKTKKHLDNQNVPTQIIRFTETICLTKTKEKASLSHNS